MSTRELAAPKVYVASRTLITEPRSPGGRVSYLSGYAVKM